jgi:hypothetical protein
MRIAILILTFLLAAHCASAVDGYKDFKFGMSPANVRKLAKIPLTASDQGNEVTMYAGEGFLFAGSSVVIQFYFVKERLLRIGFKIPADTAVATMEALTEKYGAPSSSSSQRSLKAIDTTPNIEAFVAFDENTVVLKFITDDSKELTTVLIYTSPDYDRLLLNSQKKAAKDDL